MHLNFKTTLGNFLLTLAPRAYVTYYQAQGLSGHTSPCGEYACFFEDPYFSESKVGTLHRKRNIFSLKSTMHSSNNWLLLWSNMCRFGQNTVAIVWAMFMLIEDVKVSLVEEAQDGVLLHNTWCSGTSCGGINPYTLMARLGPRGLAHYETSSRFDPTA